MIFDMSSINRWHAHVTSRHFWQIATWTSWHFQVNCNPNTLFVQLEIVTVWRGKFCPIYHQKSFIIQNFTVNTMNNIIQRKLIQLFLQSFEFFFELLSFRIQEAMFSKVLSFLVNFFFFALELSTIAYINFGKVLVTMFLNCGFHWVYQSPKKMLLKCARCKHYIKCK